MVVFDTDIFSLLLHPGADAPRNPDTGEVLDDAQQRLGYLVAQLQDAGETVLIPTPVLSEFLVFAADEAGDYMAKMNAFACIKVAPFDQRAAVELAAITREALRSGDKKSGVPSEWAKVKFDRQIVSIAKAEGAHTIYSNDDDVAKFAAMAEIEAVSVFDLRPPPPKPQRLPFEGFDEEKD